MSTTDTVSPIEEVRGNLVLMRPQFGMALPKQIPIEKFERVAMTAIQNNPDLLQADRRSLFGACMRAAQDGLLPDGKEAALVTFKGVVTYMPMISGILKKVRNSGELSSISPHVVHQGDEFEYWIDEEGEHLKHKPKLTGDRGEITHAYALAKTKDGGIYIEVMTKQELDQVRSMSQVKKGGPWEIWYGEMARKTVIRRLAKRLPMSSDLDSVIRAEDEPLTDPGIPVPSAHAEAQPKTPTKPRRARAIVEAKAAVEAPAAAEPAVEEEVI